LFLRARLPPPLLLEREDALAARAELGRLLLQRDVAGRRVAVGEVAIDEVIVGEVIVAEVIIGVLGGLRCRLGGYSHTSGGEVVALHRRSQGRVIRGVTPRLAPFYRQAVTIFTPASAKALSV